MGRVKDQGFPGDSDGKESTHNAGDLGSIPGLGRSTGEGKGYPLQCSGLENSLDYIVHGVAKSQAQLSDFHFPSLRPTDQAGANFVPRNKKAPMVPGRDVIQFFPNGAVGP